MNNDHVAATIFYLRLAHPFYAALLGHCTLVEAPHVPHACITSHREIQYNPAWFNALPVRQRGFVLCHELLHAVLGIFWRARYHDPQLANIAHDYIVNSLLAADCPEWMPPGVLHCERFEGWAYEQVYACLARDATRLPRWATDNQPDDKTWRWTENDVHNQRQAPDDNEYWTAATREATIVAAQIGKLSRGAQRLVGSLIQPKLHWSDHIRRFVRESSARERTSWSRPARRCEPAGCLLPSSVAIGSDLVIAIDASGSVSERQLAATMAECAEIVRIASGSRIRWIVADAAVLSDEYRHTPPERLTGGGGTDFRPVFERVADGRPPQALIFFTDTLGTFPDRPHFPVLWAVFDTVPAPVVPFGEILPLATQ